MISNRSCLVLVVALVAPPAILAKAEVHSFNIYALAFVNFSLTVLFRFFRVLLWQKESSSHLPDAAHMAVVASLCDHTIRERALHSYALLFNSEEWEMFMKSFACVLGFDNVNVRDRFFQCHTMPWYYIHFRFMHTPLWILCMARPRRGLC